MPSPGRFVFPAAAPAHDPAVVTSPQKWVTAHTRGNKGQGNKGQPPEAKFVIAGIARTRVRIVSFGIRHAVVQHTIRAPHTADAADAAPDSVRRILALSPPVFVMIEHVPAIDASRPLPIFFPPPWFAPGRLSLYHSTLVIVPQVEVRVSDVWISVIVFGALAFGKLNIRVSIIWVDVFPPHRGMAVVLVSRHPDLFPRINSYNFFIVVWEADVPVRSLK